MESGAQPGSRELPTLPVCQICGLDLSNARTFFRRYRICEEHAAEKEQVVDGVPQRFCQQCGRFHTLDAFDADQKSCREELARHAARRRDLRRRRKASQGLAGAAGQSGSAPSSSGQGGPADLTDLLAAVAQAGGDGHLRHHHHGRSRRRSGDPYRRVMVTGRQGMVAPGAAASPWAAASAAGQSPPEPSAAGAFAAAAGTQPLPLQRSAPEGQQTAGWSASDAQALLNTLSAGIKPAASSGLISSTTAAHLEVPNLAALSAALAGQAGSLPAGLRLGLGAAAAAAQQGSATVALGNAASDAVSGSGEYQAGLPPLPGMPPPGNSSAASAMAGLLQQLLRPPSVQIPSVRSVPVPMVQQVSLLPSAATAAPVHNPQLSAPVPGMHGRGGGAPANGGPVCQVCRSSLADMLPFYKRYRVCAEHMSAREVLRDGVPSRFCQQCGRFHPLDAFDGTQRTCREELAWRRYRRTHGGKDAHGEGRIRRHHKQQLMQKAAAAAGQPSKEEQHSGQQSRAEQQQQQQQQQPEQLPQEAQQEQQRSGASPAAKADEPGSAEGLTEQSSLLLSRQLLLLKDLDDAPTPRMENLPAAKRARLEAAPGERQEGHDAAAAATTEPQQQQQQQQPVKEEQLEDMQQDALQAGDESQPRAALPAVEPGQGSQEAGPAQLQPQPEAAAAAAASAPAQQPEQQATAAAPQPPKAQPAAASPRSGSQSGLAPQQLPQQLPAEAAHKSGPSSPGAQRQSPSAGAQGRSPASATPPSAFHYPGLAELAQLATQAQQSAARQSSEALAGLQGSGCLPPGIAQLMQLTQLAQQPSVQPMAALLAQLQQPVAQQPELPPLFAAALQQVEAQQAAAAQQEAQLAQQLAAVVAQLASQQAQAAQPPPSLHSALLQQTLGQAQAPQASLLQQVLGQAANPQASLLQALGQAQAPQPALLQQLLAAAQPQPPQPTVSPLQQALEALTGAARQSSLLPQTLPQPQVQADAGPVALSMQLGQVPSSQQPHSPQAGGADATDLLLQFSQLTPQQQAALLALARGQGAPLFGGR